MEPKDTASSSSDITSGEIASAVQETAAAGASPAQRPAATPDNAAASPRQTPESATGTGDDRYKGWVPPDAHERIVDGFHRRLDSVSWAAGLSRDEVEDALAARRASHQREQRTAAAGAEPQPDAIDEARQPYYTPQQAAKWAAWQADQIVAERMREMEARFAPIESTFAQAQQAEGLAAQIDTAQAWPGFIDHVDAITAEITKNNQDRQRNPRIPKLSLHEAYISIVPARLAQSREAIAAEEKKKWLADLNQTTAVTRNEIDPARAPARTRKKDSEMSIGELIADEVAQRRAAS